MTSRVVVGYDGTDCSERALTYAAAEWPDAAYLLVYVIDPATASTDTRSAFPTASEEWYEHEREEAGATLEEGRALVADRVASVDTRITVGRPAAQLVTAADEWGGDHIVVGSHGRTGIRRVLAGSVAETLVRTAPTPVTVVR